MKRFAPLLLLALLACTDDPQNDIPVMVVEPGLFEIAIKGDGVLQAAKATPITTPSNLRTSLTISWLAPEGAQVAEGDPLVRFDGETINQRRETAATAVRRLDFEYATKERDNSQIDRSLDIDLNLTREERVQSERFAPRDEELFSKDEIIESEVDLQLLDTKIDHFEGKIDRHGSKSDKDLQLISLKQNTQNLSVQQLDETLEALVIRAPHDGYFFLEDHPWRGKPTVGKNVWRGMKLAELPDLAQMEVKVHILEEDASGLAQGLDAIVELDGDLGRSHRATVKSVDGLAKAIERGSPVKYFEAVLQLAETLPDVMRPGGSAQARILVSSQENVISVPNQIIFHDDDQHWVYLQQDDTFIKRPVTLGERSTTRTVITEGLTAGDRVALTQPREVTP